MLMMVSPKPKLKCVVISVGVALVIVVLSPSCPLLLEPHVKTRPFDVSAEE